MPATGHVFTKPRARGDVYYMKYRVPDGRQVQKKIGPAWTKRTRPPEGYFTRAQAEGVLADTLEDADRGRLPGIKSAKTFQDACEEFLRHREEEKGCADTTMRDYRLTINRVFLPAIGADLELTKITEATLHNFLAHLRTERKVGPTTARKHMGVMSAVLDRARRRGWIGVNPADNMDRVSAPKSSGKLGAVLTPAQVMDVSRKADTPQNAALYVVAAFTGLRQGELRSLRWADVDFAQAFIHVQRNQPANGAEKLPKSGRVRSVPMIDQVATALDGLSRREHFTGPEDHVFVNTVGGALHGDDMRDQFYAAVKAAGLGHLRSEDLPAKERLRFHSLRHTFGTLAVRQWQLTEVQGYMGHANIATTMIYVHHTPRTEAARQLGDLVARELTAAAALDAQPDLQAVAA